jgi:hypothetical protein
MQATERALYGELAHMTALELFALRRELWNSDGSSAGMSERPSDPPIGSYGTHLDYSAFGLASELFGRLGVTKDDRLCVKLDDVRAVALGATGNTPTITEMLSGCLRICVGELGIIPSTRHPFKVDNPEYAQLLRCLEAAGYLRCRDQGSWQWTDLALPAMLETYDWYEDGRSLADEELDRLELAWKSMPAELKRHFIPPDSAKVGMLAVFVQRTWDGAVWDMGQIEIDKEDRPLSLLRAFGIVEQMLARFCKTP